MVIRVWTGKDYTPTEVPNELLRSLVEYLVMQRDWDRDLAKFGRLVSNTRLNIQDHLLLQAQAAAKAPVQGPVEADGIEAAAIVDALETPPAMTPAQQRMANARAAKAAKQAALTP